MIVATKWTNLIVATKWTNLFSSSSYQSFLIDSRKKFPLSVRFFYLTSTATKKKTNENKTNKHEFYYLIRKY